MNSRMEKYYKDDNGKRTHKNEELYKNVNKNEIDKFNLNSNVAVLGDNKKSIDVDALKDILDKKYTEAPKRRSIAIEEETQPEKMAEEYLDEEKDYDINAILEKARNNKKIDYNENRLKRGSNVSFDDLTKSVEVEQADDEKQDDQLMTLINTIASNEMKPVDPLDILTDLKGEEDTIVVEGASLNEYEASDTKTLDSLTDLKEEKKQSNKKESIAPLDEEPISPFEEKEESKEEKIKEKRENNFDDSFYTTSMSLKKKDFRAFDGETEETAKGVKVLIAILSIIAILIFILGIVLLLNSVFDWGLLDYFRK